MQISYLQRLQDKLQNMESFNAKFKTWQDQVLIPNKLPSERPQEFNPSLNYKKRAWRLYVLNEIIILKIKELTRNNKESHRDIVQMEEQHLRQTRGLKEKQHKKKRRTAKQIQSKIQCPYPGCQKTYSCDVSLNLHIKNKHNGGNKTERQRLARQICKARSKGLPTPEINIQFPPHYLQDMQNKFNSDSIF